MGKFSTAFSLSFVTILWLIGCATPAKRAQKKEVAFHRLAPTDQTLLLHGKVRTGLDATAVQIAWGDPDTVGQVGERQDSKDHSDSKSGQARSEIWTYRRQLSIYGPLGSYDQWQPGNYFVPPGAPRYFAAGYGIGGPGYEGLLLYRPRVRYMDSFVRRALFVDGRLTRFETYHGESSPLP